MNLKKTGKVFTSKFVGTGPSSYKKRRIYRATVSQSLRNTNLSQSEVLQWRANWFLHIQHILQTMQFLSWYHMICDVAGFCAGYFITSNLIGTQALLSAQTQFSFSGSRKWPCLGPLEHFYILYVLINFFCCLCLLTYPSKVLKFFAAFAVILFLCVWLIRISLELAS